MRDTPDMSETRTTDQQGRPNVEQVAQWVDLHEERQAGILVSPQAVWSAWETFRSECNKQGPTRERKVPTFEDFSRSLGFCSDRGLDWAARRGEEWAATIQKIRGEAIAGIVQKLLKPGQNCIGAIFWLKNRAGFRDKSPEEQRELEDWLAGIQAAARQSGFAVADRADAPPAPPEDAQLADGQEDTPDSDTPPLRVISSS